MKTNTASFNGEAKKVKVTVVSSDSFDKAMEDISKENNLVRCPGCGKLISKVSEDGKTIQNRGLQAICRGGDLTVKCPECQTCLNF